MVMPVEPAILYLRSVTCTSNCPHSGTKTETNMYAINIAPPLTVMVFFKEIYLKNIHLHY